MTIDQPEPEDQPTHPRTDSVNPSYNTSTQKLVVCAKEYLQLLHCAPELTLFVKNYVHQYQAEILSVDPAVKGATIKLRRLLADLIRESLDAMLDDVLVAVKAQNPKMIVNDPYAERAIGSVLGADDELEEALTQQNELTQKVKEELGYLVEKAKEDVDDELMSLQGR